MATKMTFKTKIINRRQFGGFYGLREKQCGEHKVKNSNVEFLNINE